MPIDASLAHVGGNEVVVVMVRGNLCSDSNKKMKVKIEQIRIFRSRNSAIPRTKDFFFIDFRES